MANRLAGLVLLATAGLFMLLVVAQLWFFGQRTSHLLAYPYPLDYGEGPLQAQLLALFQGTPLWQLYGDPATAPFLVVNYPPVMHLAAWLPALLSRGFTAGTPEAVLLGGRVVALVSGLLAVPAIWLLAGGSFQAEERRSAMLKLLVALALLGIPIVREWSSVLRVDMLGVCLGLWGLVVLRRAGQGWLVLAAVLLALSVLTKPSLLAAPLAAGCWLLFRNWRKAMLLAAATGLTGGLVVLMVQLGSGGWFWLHVVQANVNLWDHDLARAFWRDQLLLMQPLMLAGAGLVLAAQLWQRHDRSFQDRLFLPIYYVLFGLLAAVGVGKLGAYTNYFLEAYAGLFWLVAAGLPTHIAPVPGRSTLQNRVLASLALGLCGLSLLRYYPLWSEEYLLPAGIIEGRNPARISFGGYGVAQDLAREERILAARAAINRQLLPVMQAASAPILTDIPGVASQAGVLSRLQMFEHRMLLDGGLFDQRPLLRDLANGQVPLVVLDYLGNWLTPEQITLITHRYAQDLSVGSYSIYRPVDPGTAIRVAQSLGAGLTLVDAALALPGDPAGYGPGETLVVTLRVQADAPELRQSPVVVLKLFDPTGGLVAQSERVLLDGVLVPADWQSSAIQHLQPLALPPDLPGGAYSLVLQLGDGPAVPLSDVVVRVGAGRLLGEQGYYVPGPFLEEWSRLGGYDGPGDPVTPVVPFVGSQQQCYKTVCLRLAQGQFERLPVGELVWLADAALPLMPDAPPAGQLSATIAPVYEQLGGEAVLGAPLGREMKRFGMIVQYFRYARLERPIDGGPVQLGSIGDDIFRLPGGTAYRWP